MAGKISDLTEITSVDGDADFLEISQDAGSSGYVSKKVRPRNLRPLESFIVAVGDETTALTTGTAKVTFRMPYAFTVTEVRGSLVTAQTSGSAVQFDVNESGTSIFSTNPTFDNSKKTTTTAATAAVISDDALADDAEMTVDIDTVGDGTAAGLKVTLIGYRA